MAPETADKIKAYRQAESATRSPAEREAEIERHLGLVYNVVERLAVHLPPHVDREDLIHAGVIGLMDAVDRFDASRETAFSTYAVLRIRGAIIDELRARDWVPRGARSRNKDYHEAVNELFHNLDRLPTDEELADHLDTDLKGLADIERNAHLASQVSLDAPVGETGSLAGLLPSRTGHNPARRLERDDQKSILLEVLGTLKEQDRIILKLYYFEGLLMKEVAEIIGVTESRICQIHRRLMALLRVRLTNAGFVE